MEFWIILILTITNLVAISAAFSFAKASHGYRDSENYHRNEKNEYYGRLQGLQIKNTYLESLIKKPEEEVKS